MAHSAPGGDGADMTDKVSIGSATDEDDEFENLKKKRDEERLSRWVDFIFVDFIFWLLIFFVVLI